VRRTECSGVAISGMEWNGMEWKWNGTERNGVGGTWHTRALFFFFFFLVFLRVTHARIGARAHGIGNEDIGIANAQHDVVEFGVHSADAVIVEEVRNGNATNIASGEHTVPEEFGVGVAAVLPVSRQNAGIGEGISSNNRIANESGVVGDVNGAEREVERSRFAHFRLQIVVVRTVLAEQVNGVVEFAVGAVVNLLEQRSALVPRIIEEAAAAAEVLLAVKLETVRLEFPRRIAVARVLRESDQSTE
jgi:hypothetical protein